MNLTQIQPGVRYTVSGIKSDDEELKSFLFTLGCFAGEPITVISRLKYNYIVAIMNGRYSIDKHLANAITVE